MPLSTAIPTRQAIILAMVALYGVISTLALVNLSPLMDSWTVRRLVELNAEANLSVWLSSTLLLLISLGAGFCALTERAIRAASLKSRAWLAIACLFVVLSIDETSSVHELSGIVVSRYWSHIDALPGLYAWVVVFLPLGVALLAGLLYWFVVRVGWRTLPGRLGLAALAFWVWVPVLEVMDPTLGGPAWLVVLEEFMELSGEVLMLGSVWLQFHDLDRTVLRRRENPAVLAATMPEQHAEIDRNPELAAPRHN